MYRLLVVFVALPIVAQAEPMFTYLEPTDEYIITLDEPCRDDFNMVSKRAYRINNKTLDVKNGCWVNTLGGVRYVDDEQIVFKNRNEFYPVKGN